MVAVPPYDDGTGSRLAPAPSIVGRRTAMEYYAGIDVSLELSSVCVVDAKGKIVKEAERVNDNETAGV